jgi:HlyD family secretion protein
MSMDRELEPEVRRRTVGRRAAVAAGLVALVAGVLLLLPGWLRPSIARERIRTATVERGAVEEVISATGTVIPAFEQAVSSPLEARVVNIRRRPGAVVAADDVLAQLDTSSYEIERGRLADQMEQKSNQQEQLRLALDKSLIDLASLLETKRLDADVLAARADQNRRLSADGLVSAATLRVAEVESRKAQIEVRQLEAATAASRRSTQAQLEALELDLRILRKERTEVERQLALATIRADRAGVLTWVVPEEGITVHKGELVARIADLDSFRVEASVSDVHSARLEPGLKAYAVLDDLELDGRLASINPTIEDGAVKFTVDLADRKNPKLRANLRVDVLVVTARRTGVLRLPKGPFAEAGGLQQVFVVRGSQAVRRTVSLGLAGYDTFEVQSGLAAGDVVIISDMKDYLHLERVNLR